jgi:biopolymer transport protein ExbB
MDLFFDLIEKYKLVDILIVGFGLFGAIVIIDRFKALYVDLNLDSEMFMKTVMNLIQADKYEEAIAFCTANQHKPLGYIAKRILERSDCAQSDIEMAYDTASSEIAPALIKRISHLQMISNVATLIGLLGTVIGLIMSFKAVSAADPSQKQMLLANGISLAMHATALGLLVAIPVMVFYSFLHDKQNKLFGDIDRCANQLLEFLKLRSYRSGQGNGPKSSKAS